MPFFEHILKHSDVAGTMTLDDQGQVVDVNEHLLAMMCYSKEDLLGASIDEIDCVCANKIQCQNSAQPFGHFYTSLPTKKQGQLWVEICFFTQYLFEKTFHLLVIKEASAIDNDVSKLSIVEKIFNHSNEAIVVTDSNGYIQIVNDSFCGITGYSQHEVIGKTPAILNSGKQDKTFYQQFWQTLKTQGNWQGEIWNKRKNGEIFPEWLTISSIQNKHGEISHYIAQFTDITARKKTEEEQHFQAYHDSLTNLPNRDLLFEKLNDLSQKNEHTPVRFAVLFCDLDRFKYVNEAMGHKVGDELLKSIAERFDNKLRDEDLIARSGGDEFIIVIEGEKALQNIDKICWQITDLFKKPFTTPFGEFRMSISIGVSQFPQDSVDVRELISFADVAMHKVKESGGEHYAIFDAKEKRLVTQRIELEGEICKAIKERQFEVWYQSQVNCHTNAVYGVECLLRWRHPKQGLISPELFIPIAEGNGSIKELGLFVLKTAGKQLRQWRLNNLFLGVMAINVSVKQFERNDLLSQVRDVLTTEMIPGEAIELEVTESVFSEGYFQHNPILTAIRSMGVQIAIDDFGTGYSSLQRLKSLPIDNVKIDKCFVDNIVHSKEDSAIIQALILLANTFDVSLIAEGVETLEQAQTLSSLGCYNQQGYFYSKPLCAADFESWLGSFNKQHGAKSMKDKQ